MINGKLTETKKVIIETNLITLLGPHIYGENQTKQNFVGVLILATGITISTWVLQACSCLLIIFMNTNPRNL